MCKSYDLAVQQLQELLDSVGEGSVILPASLHSSVAALQFIHTAYENLLAERDDWLEKFKKLQREYTADKEAWERRERKDASLLILSRLDRLERVLLPKYILDDPSTLQTPVKDDSNGDT